MLYCIKLPLLKKKTIKVLLKRSGDEREKGLLHSDGTEIH